MMSDLPPLSLADWLRLHPFVCIVLPLMLGICSGYEWQAQLAWLAMEMGTSAEALCLMSLTATIALSLILRRHATAQSTGIALAIFTMGVYALTVQLRQTAVTLPVGDDVHSALVSSEPTRHGKVYMCDMVVVGGALSGHKVKASIFADGAPTIHLGDGMAFASTMEPLRNFREGNFDYVRWLRTRGFVARTFILPSNLRTRRLDISSLPVTDRFTLAVNKFRGKLLSRYKALGLADQDFAVVAAMTLGDKTMLDKRTKQNYSVTGAAHILAVSGLHLGVIYTLLTFFFGKTRQSCLLTQAILLPSLWAYAALTGLSPSVVRAATMLTVYSFGMMMGRQRLSLNVLALTATILLLFSPLYLWDISFQMSFMAMLGIMLFYHPVNNLISQRWLSRHHVCRWAWGIIAISIAAQMLTAPLVAYYFGRFSSYSLLTNLIAVPAATVIIHLAAIFFAATPIAPLQAVVAQMLAAVANYLNELLLLITRLPGASIEDTTLDTPRLFTIYTLIACSCGLIHLARTLYYSKHPWLFIPVNDKLTTDS